MALLTSAGRVHRAHLHFLACLSLRSIFHRILYGPGSAGRISRVSQTFYQNLLVPSVSLVHNRLYFSPHQPFAFQNLCPIDLSELGDKENEIKELGVTKIVELVKKAADFTLKTESMAFLDDSSIEPNENLVYLAIWALRDDWESAMSVFKWGEKWGCNCEKILGLIVWVLSSEKQFSVAWCLIRDSLQLRMDTRRAMLVMIERYAAANYPQKAVKTFDIMEKLRISPDQNAFYTLLSALCKNGNVEEAEEILFHNKKLYPLETEGFNIILDGWCNISVDVFEAKRVWREMSKCCIVPDAISYTLMISCFSRVGNLFDSLRLYDDMKKRDWIPNLEVFNSLIYVLARENCVNEALRILKKIKETGLLPDSNSYNSLIGPLSEAKKFDEARSVLAAMIEDNISPTIETYHAFMDGSNYECTLEILNQMKKACLGPNRDTFLLVFDELFRSGQPENALKIWVEMKSFGVEAESAHYVAILQGLATVGCLVKARELYTEMISKGYPDEPKLKRVLKEHLRHSHQRGGSVNVVRHVKKDLTACGISACGLLQARLLICNLSTVLSGLLKLVSTTDCSNFSIKLNIWPCPFVGKE
ncbi:hypothetical protein Ancab_029865 [Ancistrocladus abbreviatus]